MLVLKLRALTTLVLLGVSALLLAQDFYFENELSFRLDRKCAESELIPSKVFQETEEIFSSSAVLSTISGENYKLFCNELAKSNFSFDSILISEELFDKHIAYYSHFNGLWQEMWTEDSAFAAKSHFYGLKTTIDSCMAANPDAGVANTFTAFSQMSDGLFFVPFYRNLLLNWAVVAYFEPETGLPVALPKAPVYNLSGVLQNVLVIRITSEDEILVAGDKSEKKSTLDDVRNRVIAHITNEGKDPNLAVSSKQAMVSLKNERGTSYQTYVEVYNAIVAAYNEVREDFAQKVYKLSYHELSNEQQKVINTKYPKKIAEAEPVSSDK